MQFLKKISVVCNLVNDIFLELHGAMKWAIVIPYNKALSKHPTESSQSNSIYPQRLQHEDNYRLWGSITQFNNSGISYFSWIAKLFILKITHHHTFLKVHLLQTTTTLQKEEMHSTTNQLVWKKVGDLYCTLIIQSTICMKSPIYTCTLHLASKL